GQMTLINPRCAACKRSLPDERERFTIEVGSGFFTLHQETSTDLTKQTTPACVGLPGKAGPWPVHVLPVLAEGESFEAKLLSFLKHEGKTITDVKGLLKPSPLDMNTALINAISSLVDKCNTAPADTQSYRKLCVFSGVRPNPNGEEEYDAWAEQTMHLLEEWQCSDNVKKQRIVESLKGPATAFGTTESEKQDSPEEPGDDPRFSGEFLVRSELQVPTVVMSKKITVLVRNVSKKEVTLTRGMPVAHLSYIDLRNAGCSPVSSMLTQVPERKDISAASVRAMCQMAEVNK
uniref:Paraneoplastic antigen Ma-like C-terminal domain-containing protein n=1 Tax=Cyprinus carpio TaxID=7962 RepID=A0A8C1LTE1_CYPCA